jgi:hypothetical protein
MKRTIVIKDAEAAPGRSRDTFRMVATVICALVADGLQWVLPFLWPICDGAMVVAVLVLWGWRWEVLVAVIPELIPGLELAPTWTIFAGYLIMARRGGSPASGTVTKTKAPEKRVDPL